MTKMEKDKKFQEFLKSWDNWNAVGESVNRHTATLENC